MSRSVRSLRRTLLPLTFLGLVLASADAQAAPACPSEVLNTPKGNQLYLYFATASDASFPLYHADALTSGATSPLAPFKVADLDSTIGTTAQLRDRIFDFVADDYCEFNVGVTATTSMPSPSAARWQIVGLGTDSATLNWDELFGIAQDVDTNDSDPKDYARVFARSFKDAYGGNVLSGGGSTLERWATAIGETTAHEAAHNFGAAHGNAYPIPNSAEDGVNWHLMATGSSGLTGEMRASRDRHFSDTEYEVLGHNIGLHTKHLYNWDFINPNDTEADSQRLKLLSNKNSLTVHWSYDGYSSPWKKPTVTYTGTTQSFQGTTYYVHDLDFTLAKSWKGATPGVVEAGEDFHTGATFAGNDTEVIVFDVQLFNGGTLLPLAPRLPGYNAGSFDLGSGDFSLDFFNTDPAAGELVLSEVVVFRSPRMLDISAMMRDARPVDVRGVPVEFHSRKSFEQVGLRENARLTLANLTDKRTVDILYGPEDCPEPRAGRSTGEATGDAESSEMKYCHKGNALSLFPSTYTYLIAKVVEPNARYWSREKKAFVTGPLQSILYYQLAGTLPDFNHNGIDDLIDIRTGTSRDEDRNGVPDEAQPRR